MSTKILTFLVLSFAAAAFADDFKILNGKEYKDVAVTRVEPDGIVVKTKSGVTKVYFAELPKEVQEKFHYDPQQAAAYSSEQAANYAAYQQQQQKEQDEARRQQEDVAAKNRATSAQQQANYNRVQALQDRYAMLQQEEDSLLRQIGEAERPGSAYWIGRHRYYNPNPRREDLPLLKSHLSDVRHEKAEVRNQLDKAQR